MKKKITAIVLVVVVLAMLFTGMTLAYFTDEKEAENVFVFGDIDIELEEPGWNPDEDGGEDDGAMEGVLPGMSFDKAPTITNTGNADAYIRMGVQINPAVLKDLTGGTDVAALGVILENLDPANSGWVYESTETGEGVVTFWFRGGILIPDGSSAPLFTAVKIPANYTDDNVEDLMGPNRNFGIKVIAQAIQTYGFDTADAAYDALIKEYGNP